MDVGKGGAKRGNHLFKAFAPLLLARKRIEFHEINGDETRFVLSRPSESAYDA